jgi:hypothetical protein
LRLSPRGPDVKNAQIPGDCTRIGGLIQEAVPIAIVPIAVVTIGIIGAEAATEASVAGALTEPSVAEAATEASAAEAAMEVSAAEAAMEVSASEAAMEASFAVGQDRGTRERNAEDKSRKRSGNRLEE